jgi:asparagine synthase (glutamine-hydrolysing)
MLTSGEPALNPGWAGNTSRRWAGGDNPLGITDLEVAGGLIADPGRRTKPPARTKDHPVEALERVLLPLLQRPPLAVAFSGGRDSSVLLATAARLARREGLPPPVALTARWANDPDSDESDWQEAVIRSVQVTDWQRIDPGTQLDLLGPYARRALECDGLLWPAPAYAFIPLFRAANGGTVISGEGGDEMFGVWPMSALRKAVGERRLPALSSLRGLAAGCTPYPVRYRLTRRRVRPYQDWLRPSARQRWCEIEAAESAGLPLRFGRYLANLAASRDFFLTTRTLRGLAAAEGSDFAAPFLADQFVAALAAFGGATGIGDRQAVMTAVFGDLLPPSVLTRTGKATFGNVFWGPESRQFARDWDGRGLPEALVDPDRLRQAWLQDRPVYASALPLQAAWLAARRPADAPDPAAP